MNTREGRVRTAQRLALLPVLLIGLVGCGADIFDTADVYSLAISPTVVSLVRGGTMQLTVDARDEEGRMIDARIEWSSANEHIVSVSGSGLVTAVGTGGPIEIVATAGSERAGAQITVRTTDPVSPAVAAMLERISLFIDQELRHLEELLPLNPRREEDILAKIALLERPTLASEVIDGHLFAEDSARSIDGTTVPIVSVYPLAVLEGEAATATHTLALALPVLERFVGAPIPVAAVQVWQGFTLGGSGGNGTIVIEDQATYDNVSPIPGLPYKLPWRAILTHELAHSFIGNEGLAQFLELYAYNLIETGSADIGHWVFTRGHVPLQATNTQIHALLDIYVLMGEEAMSRAYAAVRPLQPRYGEPLSADARQAFIEEAPPDLRDTVATKISQVTF